MGTWLSSLPETSETSDTSDTSEDIEEDPEDEFGDLDDNHEPSLVQEVPKYLKPRPKTLKARKLAPSSNICGFVCDEDDSRNSDDINQSSETSNISDCSLLMRDTRAGTDIENLIYIEQNTVMIAESYDRMATLPSLAEPPSKPKCKTSRNTSTKVINKNQSSEKMGEKTRLLNRHVSEIEQTKTSLPISNKKGNKVVNKSSLLENTISPDIKVSPKFKSNIGILNKSIPFSVLNSSINKSRRIYESSTLNMYFPSNITQVPDEMPSKTALNCHSSCISEEKNSIKFPLSDLKGKRKRKALCRIRCSLKSRSYTPELKSVKVLSGKVKASQKSKYKSPGKTETNVDFDKKLSCCCFGENFNYNCNCNSNFNNCITLKNSASKANKHSILKKALE